MRNTEPKCNVCLFYEKTPLWSACTLTYRSDLTLKFKLGTIIYSNSCQLPELNVLMRITVLFWISCHYSWLIMEAMLFYLNKSVLILTRPNHFQNDQLMKNHSPRNKYEMKTQSKARVHSLLVVSFGWSLPVQKFGLFRNPSAHSLDIYKFKQRQELSRIETEKNGFKDSILIMHRGLNTAQTSSGLIWVCYHHWTFREH